MDDVIAWAICLFLGFCVGHSVGRLSGRAAAAQEIVDRIKLAVAAPQSGE